MMVFFWYTFDKPICVTIDEDRKQLLTLLVLMPIDACLLLDALEGLLDLLFLLGTELVLRFDHGIRRSLLLDDFHVLLDLLLEVL